MLLYCVRICSIIDVRNNISVYKTIDTRDRINTSKRSYLIMRHPGSDASSTRYSDAARETRNRYAREWRAKHPDKVKEARRRYWERKAEKEAAGNAKRDEP